MIEYELTFLAKSLPNGLENCEKREILDIYLPSVAWHCDLRIRRNGKKYEITRKNPVGDDASVQRETNIVISKEEFEELAQVEGKRVHKIRHYLPYKGKTAEVDVFLDKLEGLVLVEVEFESEEEKNTFKYPDFCLAEVTQEDFIAGGMLAGKSYE
ncbi:CYTH domain-containing protein, partial [Patescibacteria group bacterium]|nr:CYTH domain-containing protein [Patescibacteria group bacterium]